MADRIRISCINKSNRQNPWERIINVGGVNADGTRWKLSQLKAIEGTENGTWAFFVRVGDHDVKVIVAVSRFGNKYLKTEADTDTKDNLLSLTECP